MSRLAVLLHKDWTESLRKHRLLVLVLVFLMFGILSPVTARYLPQIVDLILGSSGDILDMGIVIPDPVLNDSYLQYYKNMTQMGMFVMILVMMGIISDEKRKGTAVLVLTKSVSRQTFILSKYIMAMTVLFLSMIVSYTAFYFYTWMMFDERPLNGAFSGFFMFVLLMAFVMSLTFFASTVARSTALAAMIAIGGYFSVTLVSALPKVSEYFPMYLLDAAYQISIGVSGISGFLPVILISFGGCLLLLFLSIISFRYQEL